MRKLWNKTDSDVIAAAIKMLAASRVTLTVIKDLHQRMDYVVVCRECYLDYPCTTIQLIDGEQ
jgi:hypothetical protein